MRLLPNAITLARLLLVPLFGWSILAHRTVLAPALLAAIAFSDWLDGFLARRYRAESRLGALLDPIADKVTQLSGLVLLAHAGPGPFTRVPLFFVALVLMREMMLVYGAVRVRLVRGTVRIRPRFEGKASTGAVFALLLAACLGAPVWVVWTLCALGAPFVVVSGVRYVIDGYRQMRSEGASGA
ncbi:MAG: CDP-alcohol phosphatidyltransferase family protein [Planctomycetota bacterium]